MAKKNKPIVAAQLYTFRDFLQDPKMMPKTFAKIKKIGYDAAQISGLGPIDATELRNIMIGEGVEPIGAHVSLAQFREDTKKAIQDCKDWGVKYVAIPWMATPENPTAATWKAYAKEFDKYAAILAKEDIVLQYHNHMFEFEQVGIKGGKGGATALEILYGSTKLLQAELDFGWVVRGGNDPVAWATKMNGRIDQVHLKDWSIYKNEVTWRALGEGRIQWPEIIKACKKSGTHTFIVEQDSCFVTNEPFKSLKISREYLASLGM